jgi:hypothetical protein
VSVTCLVEPGGVFFWVTKESGKLEACKEVVGRGRGHKENTLLRVRTAVVAVKAVSQVGKCFYSGVGVAELSVQALEAVAGGVSADLWRLSQCRARVQRGFHPLGREHLREVRSYIVQLEYGMYSSGAGCCCNSGLVCDQCAGRARAGWFRARDWTMDVGRVLAEGPEMFRTDGVGTVSVCSGYERQWLRCADAQELCKACRESCVDECLQGLPRGEEIVAWVRARSLAGAQGTT